MRAHRDAWDYYGTNLYTKICKMQICATNLINISLYGTAVQENEFT